MLAGGHLFCGTVFLAGRIACMWAFVNCTRVVTNNVLDEASAGDLSHETRKSVL